MRLVFTFLFLFAALPQLALAHNSVCDDHLLPPAGALDPWSFLPRAMHAKTYSLYVDLEHFTDDAYVFVELSHNDERIGRIVTTDAHLPGKIAVIHNVTLHPKYQGKKLGLLLYLTAARELYKKGYVLMKAGDTSAAADSMWDGLYARGLAVKLGDGNDAGYIFSSRVLSDKAAWGPLDAFVKQHEEND